MPSYITQLEHMAQAADVPLKRAFWWAGIAESTYYRTKHRKTELRHDTACKIAQEIENYVCLERLKADVRKLRRHGKDFDIRTLKKQHKPRRAGV